MSYYSLPACVFHQCEAPPTTIVVWGCYEHVDEFVACPPHLAEWISYHDSRNIRCTFCYEYSEAFITRGIEHLRTQLRTHHP
jgi:hypothetical protein